MGTVSVSKTIKKKWNTSGYEEIVGDILGKKFNLSIVLIADKKARSLNMKYRNKKNPANILTFPISKDTGEIFINIAGVKREARKFGLSQKNYAKFLLIHGCLHLKGYAHGSTMESAEDKLLKKHTLR
jgi:probable rRNA maturation factor